MHQSHICPLVFCSKAQEVLVETRGYPPGTCKLLHQRQLVPFWAMRVAVHSILSTPDTQQEVPAVVR